MPAKRKPARRPKAPALPPLSPDLVAALLELAEREKLTPEELIARGVFGAHLSGAYDAREFDENAGHPHTWYLWQAEADGNRAAWWILRGLSSSSGDPVLGPLACERAAACPDLPALLDYLPGPARECLLEIPAIADAMEKARPARRRAA